MKNGNAFASDTVVHAAELENRCEYAPAVSVFLTPSEQAELTKLVKLPHRLFFWGGFSDAERRAAVFLPEWAAEAAPYTDAAHTGSPDREEYLKSLIFGDDAPFPELSQEIALIKINGSGHRALFHRDILGALMGLGITRQSAGDICMLSDSDAVTVISGRLTDFVCEELVKVGSDGVTVTAYPDPASFVCNRQFEELSVTVASMRLDGVVSALTGLSRTKTDEYISAKSVQLCGSVTDKTDAAVSVGDTVTVRGFGKYLVASTDGVTRKSRIRIKAKKYL